MPNLIQHSKFMQDTKTKLMEKVKENTAMKYIRDLYYINNDKPFNNLTFLKKPDAVMSKLQKRKLATSTQKNYVASILSILSVHKDKKGIEELHNKYTEIMDNIVKVLESENPENTKSKKQEKNWISWDEILKKRDELETTIRQDLKGLKFKDMDKRKHYNVLLNTVVLSIYTLIPPRRNDYAIMEVVQDEKDASNDRMNYLVLNDSKFIYNNYKTDKTFGKQEIDIPKNLMNVIKLYLRFHPLLQTKPKTYPVDFLVMSDGKRIPKNNGITRILNRIFDNKNIGSSLLRHIFLTDKYGDVLQEKNEMAKKMGHSVGMQNEYVVHKEKE